MVARWNKLLGEVVEVVSGHEFKGMLDGAWPSVFGEDGV